MKIQLLNESARIPVRAYPTDAGADLFSVEDAVLQPGERKLIGTGVAVEIPNGFVGYVCPRSGLAHKYGVSVANAPGVVDAAYRGEVKVNLINLGQDPFVIEPGMKIAQLVVQEVKLVQFEVVGSLSGTDRGANGHGSTGR